MYPGKMLDPLPFRFLDLPKELRFMVYEHLAISTKQYHLTPIEGTSGFQVCVPPQGDRGSSHTRPPALTITLHTLPVQVFSTCSLVYSEALPFLSRKLDVICETVPRIVIDPECLDTSQTQELFRKLLDRLDGHPFFTAQKLKLGTLRPTTQEEAPVILNSNSLTHREKETDVSEKNEQYPEEIRLWLDQTTHLLLSQRPNPCPFAGFMGTRVYPTVRLVLDVRGFRPSSAPRSVASIQPPRGPLPQTRSGGMAAHEATVSPSLPPPPVHTTNTDPAITRSLSRSVASRLSILYSGLVHYTRGLRYVRSGAIVLGQAESSGRRMVREGEGGVWKRVALDFGIVRVSERGFCVSA